MKKPKKPTTADIKRDVAAKITEHLNALAEMRAFQLYNPDARHHNRGVAITYLSYQNAFVLSLEEAQAYLQWLNAGHVGTHMQQQRNPDPPVEEYVVQGWVPVAATARVKASSPVAARVLAAREGALWILNAGLRRAGRAAIGMEPVACGKKLEEPCTSPMSPERSGEAREVDLATLLPHLETDICTLRNGGEDDPVAEEVWHTDPGDGLCGWSISVGGVQVAFVEAYGEGDLDDWRDAICRAGATMAKLRDLVLGLRCLVEPKHCNHSCLEPPGDPGTCRRCGALVGTEHSADCDYVYAYDGRSAVHS